jgi:tetratricopeptide (TPR) repeat protein
MTVLKPKQDMHETDFLKRFFILVALVMIILPRPSQAERTTHHRLFFKAIAYYQQDRYSEAVKAFKHIVQSGIQNGWLFYNLGNACLKNGDIGHAILYYERAAILIPNDPDLKFNLNYARTLVKDKQPDPPSSILSVLFSWKRFFGKRTVQWLALFLNLMFWVCLTIWLIRRKKRVTAISMTLMSIAGLFVVLACYDYISPKLMAGQRDAVILPAEISVRSGWSENSTELFVLHAGTKIKVEREKDGYYRICFSEGKIGWIPKKQAGLVQT